MEIEMISCEKVKPSTPTPTHLQTYKLSMLDQLSQPSVISVVLYYSCSTQDGADVIRFDPQTREQRLKLSLSHTLTQFYPVAGRTSADFQSVDCNDEGVPFFVAKVKGGLRLSELLENYRADPKVCGQPLIPCPVGLTVEWDSGTNVAMIQLTHFACGSIAVGIVFLHKIGDGVTLANFIKYWAAATTPGAELLLGPDYSIPQSMFPPKQELQAVTGSLKEYFYKGKYLMRRYIFDGSAIRRLKAQASKVVESPTRVEVVTALLWKCYMFASLANGNLSSALVHVVNLRRRARPPLPSECFGNLAAFAVGSCTNNTGSDDEEDVFPHLVKKTRDITSRVDDSYVKRMCGNQGLTGYYENKKNTWTGVADPGMSPDALFFSSWCGIGFYDADFGWGKPIWMSKCDLTDTTSSYTNIAWLMDTKHGDGVEAWLIMDEKYIQVFDNIQLLKDHAQSEHLTCVS